jgi:YesN/AraC family two-component response regulator
MVNQPVLIVDDEEDILDSIELELQELDTIEIIRTAKNTPIL